MTNLDVRADQQSQGSRLLFGAGLVSAVIAALHAVIIVVGAKGYRYFGAGELADQATAGSHIPAVLTTILVLVFATWSWYGFAGSGRMRRPPLLLLGLWVIGAIYTARGLAFFPELVGVRRGRTAIPARYVVFSLVALVTGLLFLAGTWRARVRLVKR